MNEFDDIPTVHEILAECRSFLRWLETSPTSELPPWITRDEAISQMREEIRGLEGSL